VTHVLGDDIMTVEDLIVIVCTQDITQK
jgi:hypothetical protein